MSASIDRAVWPWHSAPAACTDWDAASWYALRSASAEMGGPLLPRQDLETWVREQRARRTRDAVGHELPITELLRQRAAGVRR